MFQNYISLNAEEIQKLNFGYCDCWKKVTQLTTPRREFSHMIRQTDYKFEGLNSLADLLLLSGVTTVSIYLETTQREYLTSINI